MPREKDTRKILSGVQRYEKKGLRTYTAGMEDDLEAVMSPGEYADLKARGAIEGDWSPEGDPPALMRGSAADRDIDADADKRRKKESAIDKERAEEAKAKEKAKAERAKELDAEKADAGTPPRRRWAGARRADEEEGPATQSESQGEPQGEPTEESEPE